MHTDTDSATNMQSLAPPLILTYIYIFIYFPRDMCGMPLMAVECKSLHVQWHVYRVCVSVCVYISTPKKRISPTQSTENTSQWEKQRCGWCRDSRAQPRKTQLETTRRPCCRFVQPPVANSFNLFVMYIHLNVHVYLLTHIIRRSHLPRTRSRSPTKRALPFTKYERVNTQCSTLLYGENLRKLSYLRV